MFLSYASHELPSVEEFRTVLGPKGEQGEVGEVSMKSFDPKGEYRGVVEKVEQAGTGGVRVFRVEIDGTRVEYYVVTVGERSLVGVVAKAVES